MTTPIIFWYRQDLRTHDLPGLRAAAATGQPIIPCYILDDVTPGHWRMGSASRWWLHHSLQSLAEDIRDLGGRLVTRRGSTLQVLTELLEETGALEIYCTRMYEPWAAELEHALHGEFQTKDITFKRFGGALLHEPENILNLSGKPYKVFTPFWRRCLAEPEPERPQPIPDNTGWWTDSVTSEDIGGWSLPPQKPDWAADWTQWWTPGAQGAQEKLRAFLDDGLENYSEGRNHPALECTTRLSPHLHFGEMSPREVWHRAREVGAMQPKLAGEVAKLLSEMGWREFSHQLLHYFPSIPEEAFKAQFRQFPWLPDDGRLAAWQQGLTGYPIVDAGMRELWQTGYMHNRVRMIVASFLTKHLLIHWREGANWFWDTLLDADLANNSSGWQWVAGSGADASPYFRIFNPILQGEKFDAEGEYIREWVPELSRLPKRYLNCPWEAPPEVLETAGVELGKDYPHPIVDHKAARESALAAYKSLAKAK
ncbi:MAG: deoxyribodipyrimidine photo-lyase [Halioglobus sp.]|jgi:deoxyribodipyrimidine photo-lyase